MADVEKFMSVEAGDIEKIMGVAVGDIETVMGLSIVTMQAYEGQTFLCIGGYMSDTRTTTNGIQQKTSTSNGNSSNFGDTVAGTGMLADPASAGGGGRGVTAAGGVFKVTGGSDNYSWTEIYYVTIASAGDSADTNDNMPLTVLGPRGAGNGVKMAKCGGYNINLSGNARYGDWIQRYTIASGADGADTVYRLTFLYR